MEVVKEDVAGSVVLKIIVKLPPPLRYPFAGSGMNIMPFVAGADAKNE